MTRSIRLLVVLALALASAPSAAVAQAPDTGEDQAFPVHGPRLVSMSGAPGDRLAVAGEFLVKLNGSSLLGRSTEQVGFGWSLLRDTSPAAPAVRAAQLSAELGVPVVPNGVSQLFADNPEPDADQQWPLDNTFGSPDADIDGEEAWDITRGSGVVVAILDSGADRDHPDLADNLWTNSGEVPNNNIDDDNNGYVDDVAGWDFYAGDNDPDDEGGGGHGSAVTGIVAAPINGTGIAGVAPEATVMPVRVCGTLGCFDNDVIAGLAYAGANGASIANLSLGRGPGDTFFDDLFEDAFSTSVSSGMLIVAAAGNDGQDNDTTDPDPLSLPNWPALPASFPITGLLAVAMTDSTDALDSFSNYGATTVDLAAPGVDVYSTIPGGYAYVDGTSFSSPHVAGTAALVLAQDGCLTPAQVEARIKRGADRLDNLSGLVATGARLNAYGALTSYAASSSTTYGGAPFSVDFQLDVCSGDYPWQFGDGTSATGHAVSHTYTTPGVYEAIVEYNGGSRRFEIIAGLPFTDIAGNPFEKEIHWLAATAVTLGCDTAGPTFCPDDTVTRGQMASFLVRALDLPPATADYFTDDATSTHRDNINRLREAGVTLGCDTSGTLFCPDDEITREQMATFLVRGYGIASTASDYFTDDGGVHQTNINSLAESGITLGCSESLYCPKDPVPRRQMAAFLFRAGEL